MKQLIHQSLLAGLVNTLGQILHLQITVLIQKLCHLRIELSLSKLQTKMALDHIAPSSGFVKGMSKILKQGYHGFITKLQRRQNAVKIPGKSLVVLPQLFSLIPHVMLNLMPAFEKHGLDLDFKGIINIHIPCLRGNLRS